MYVCMYVYIYIYIHPYIGELSWLALRQLRRKVFKDGACGWNFGSPPCLTQGYICVNIYIYVYIYIYIHI